MKECAFHEVPTLAPLHLLEKSEGGFCLPISVMPAILGGVSPSSPISKASEYWQLSFDIFYIVFSYVKKIPVKVQIH